MENKLRNLYALQHIDSNLDELEEMKGDLPAEIGDLEGKADELQTHKAALEETHEKCLRAARRADSEILSLKDKARTVQDRSNSRSATTGNTMP